MPKAATQKYYAVFNGRHGPKIYDTIDEYRAALDGLSGAVGQKFYSREKAEEWLQCPNCRTKAKKKKSRRRYPDTPTLWTEFEEDPRMLASMTDAAVNVTKVEACVQTDEPIEYDPPIRIQGSPPPLPTPAGSPKREYPSCAATVPPAEHASAGPERQVAAVAPVVTNDVQLSPEQLMVLDLVKTGKNVFFTGPAGTGKSVLLREVIRILKGIKGQDAVFITAPTGIASVNVGGSTIYSWAGVGLGNESAEKLAQRISASIVLKERWVKCATLIIDEISMLDGHLFDKLEYIGRKVRKNPKPFGGIQLVISGDFFQLPPVPNKSHQYCMPPIFAFDSRAWAKCIGKPVLLNKIFRQKDNEFIDILSAMRYGELQQRHVNRLTSLSRPVTYPDGIGPTYIFPLRAEVESCNNTRLAALPGALQTYRAVDAVGWDIANQRLTASEAKPLLDGLIAPAEVSVKIGAQVMLIQNVVQGQLVNGSLGRVEDFCTVHEAVERHISIAEIKMINGRPYGGVDDGKPHIRQMPIENMLPLNEEVFSKKQRFPVVHFDNGLELLCAPLMFTVEGALGNVEVSRMQVPLILAWALSVHKSQGQTLSRVKVDLGNIFEKGQAYVAVSRATSMEGLEIVNFHPSKVQAHPRVKAWQAEWGPPIKRELSIEEEMDNEDAIASYYAD